MANGSNPILQVLLLIFLFLSAFSFVRSCGLAFCSANFRKERPSGGWSRHPARQQSPSCHVVTVHCVPRIVVLTERCTFQSETSERTFGAGVGQDLCIHLPISTGLGMPSNWTRGRGTAHY